jgi:hypothetical protein
MPDRHRGEASRAELEPEQRPAAPGEVIPHPPPEGHAESRRNSLETARERLFAGNDATAILARISNGDPLRLYELGAVRVRERFLFIDLERLHEVGLAFVARAAAVDGESRVNEAWLRDRIDRAIDSILWEDREEQRSLAAPNDPDDRRYRTLAITLGITHSAARSALVAFNALSDRARRGFFRLLIENVPVPETLAEGHWNTPDELRHDVWDGLRALGHLKEGEVLGAHQGRGKRKQP